eukprot:TRINITY_DN60884_c0_g1_i1.p1 TRINITY_DN60884_c0_g1~~TRINITY_DN60884_c0_g1_i1.p1  ORF type:complete len:555 (+),score=90.47 TRINITY_DN60884_c0_g1_i1:31-1665(+)
MGRGLSIASALLLLLSLLILTAATPAAAAAAVSSDLLFEQLDRDSDGYLSKAEFRPGGKLGEVLPKAPAAPGRRAAEASPAGGSCQAVGGTDDADGSKDCAVFFWAYHKEKTDGSTAVFKNLQKSLEIARAMAPGLHFILGYSELSGKKGSKLYKQIAHLEKKVEGPFTTHDLGSAAVWVDRMYPAMSKEDKERLAHVVYKYPHPLKAAVWSEAARYCSRMVALDMDVVFFHDIRELLYPLSPSKPLIAPPESHSPAWCEENWRSVGKTKEACIRIGDTSGWDPVDSKKVQKAICDECGCPGYTPGDAVEQPTWQASVISMGPEVLRLWSNQSFLLNYLRTTMRVFEGSRPKAGEASDYTYEDFWQYLPDTGEPPIPFPHYDSQRPKAYWAEQVAYFIVFGCAGIKPSLWDRRSVTAGIALDEQTLAAVGGLCNGPIALHTFFSHFDRALAWYPSWWQMCAPPGAPDLSWETWPKKPADDQPVFLTGSIQLDKASHSVPVYVGQTADEVARLFARKNHLKVDSEKEVHALVASWIAQEERNRAR